MNSKVLNTMLEKRVLDYNVNDANGVANSQSNLTQFCWEVPRSKR